MRDLMSYTPIALVFACRGYGTAGSDFSSERSEERFQLVPPSAGKNAQ